MGLEVVVLGQDAGTEELFLQDLHEVQEVLGLAATDVVHLVGRDGQTVFAGLLGRSLLHHSYNALNDIVHIGEIPAAVAVVVDLDGLALEQFVGEAKVGHIRTAGRAIDGEEAEAGAGNVVELAVAMRHELVTLLGGGIETYGIIYPVVRAERHLLVAAIDGTAAGIHQVLHRVVSAGFQDIVEAYHIALDVGIGVLDGVTNPSLGSEVDNDIKVIRGKQLVNLALVCDIHLPEYAFGILCAIIPYALTERCNLVSELVYFKLIHTSSYRTAETKLR